MSNSGTYPELRTTSFIESMGVACSDSVCHNQVQALSIPVLLLAYSQDWTCNLQMTVAKEALGTNAYNRYAMCPELPWPENPASTLHDMHMSPTMLVGFSGHWNSLYNIILILKKW